jgi:hypothetical protein
VTVVSVTKAVVEIDGKINLSYTHIMFFRSMSPAQDGLPVVGRSGRALGVRVPEDVRPDAEGRVHPGHGGMSFAPRSMWHLPHHRRPRPMGRGSSGPAIDRVFALARAVVSSTDLVVRLDPHRPDKHAFIEPSKAVPLPSYEAMLASTRPDWQQVWP